MAKSVDSEYRLNGRIAAWSGLLGTFFSLEFSDHRGQTGLLPGGGVLMNDPLGARLVQCLDGITKESVGILNVTSPDCLHDILTTIPHKRAAGTISIPSSNVLTKSLFGTGYIRHTILFI